MIIRQAVDTDLDVIISLLAQLGYPSHPVEILERLRKIRLDPLNHRILLAQNGLQSLGLVHLQVRNTLMSESYVEIVSLVVDEQARGQGIGTALLGAAEEWAAGMKIDLMQLYSNAIREKAHQFYLKNGYTRVKDSVMLKKSGIINNDIPNPG